MAPTLFLTWIEHRRTRHLCVKLGLPLLELVSKRRGVLRYVSLVGRTLLELRRRRPQVLLVQNPSLVLAMLCLVLRPLLRYRLVVDAHNEAVEPFLHRTWLIVRISTLLLSRADLTIVTNDGLAEVVRHHGGMPIVLPDGIPAPPLEAVRQPMPEGFNLVLISTFARDEPFPAVVEAMRQVEPGVRLHVTGNAEKLPATVRDGLPANITLTGFLDETSYWSLLASCDAVMDLTLMKDCLVCGAYEAVATARPMILSSNRASMALFREFAVFTDNTSRGILQAISSVRIRGAEFLASHESARQQFESDWQICADELRKQIALMLPAPGS